MNGKEKTFEREFDNYAEYANFVGGGVAPGSSLNVHAPHGSWIGPAHYGFPGYSYFEEDEEVEDLEKSKEDGVHFDSPVDISKYEKEIRRMENDKKNLKAKKLQLEETKKTLEGYLEKFKKAKKAELVKELERDIAVVEKELKSL